MKVDINADIGEGYAYDADLLKIIGSANVCCGEHAGSESLTEATVFQCKLAQVRIGAHPGFPDRVGMGRRSPSNTEIDVWLSSLANQVERFVNKFDTDYIKPHGAVYNILAQGKSAHSSLWDRMVDVLKIARRPLMGLPGSGHERLAEEAGIGFIREGFADRKYGSNGLLVPRSVPGSVLDDLDQIVRQVEQLATKVDSICIHGDAPDCVEVAKRVKATLSGSGASLQ